MTSILKYVQLILSGHSNLIFIKLVDNVVSEFLDFVVRNLIHDLVDHIEALKVDEADGILFFETGDILY